MLKEIMNDKIMFITTLVIILTIPLSFKGVSALTIGGLLLMYGAWYVANGNVFYSIIVYTLADICWLINAYLSNDLFAAVTVSVGIGTGLYVTYKMQRGTFRKSILKELNE
jgi:hypothetical protein